MIKYKDYAPTQFDRHINFDDNREDWYVLEVTQNRDSGVWSRCNFQAALARLGGESETCEVHRFGHWGPGWFELILLAPERLADGESIEADLADHPILDEELLSQMEFDEEDEDWSNWAGRSYIDKLVEVFNLSESTKDWLRDHEGELLEFHRKWNHSGCALDYGFNYLETAEHPDREDLTAWIREQRKK